jgi:hypothetical protein
MAPDGTVRSDSRLNLVILARFDPAALTDETRAVRARVPLDCMVRSRPLARLRLIVRTPSRLDREDAD